MTEISVGFTIVTPGSLDPGMHFGLEVKWFDNNFIILGNDNCIIIDAKVVNEIS